MPSRNRASRTCCPRCARKLARRNGASWPRRRSEASVAAWTRAGLGSFSPTTPCRLPARWPREQSRVRVSGRGRIDAVYACVRRDVHRGCHRPGAERASVRDDLARDQRHSAGVLDAPGNRAQFESRTPGRPGMVQMEPGEAQPRPHRHRLRCRGGRSQNRPAGSGLHASRAHEQRE